MDYYISLTAVQMIRWDKPNILLDNSVPRFLQIIRHEKKKKAIVKEALWKILVDNVKFYPWKKFGTHEEVLRILQGIVCEICLDEMETAIDLFEKRGILKTVNYLFSCVE